MNSEMFEGCFVDRKADLRLKVPHNPYLSVLGSLEGF